MNHRLPALAILIIAASTAPAYFHWFDGDRSAKTDAQVVSALSPEDKWRLMVERYRNSLAEWDKFPGFTAHAAVDIDGKYGYAKIAVNAAGKVSLENLHWQGVAHPALAPEAAAWTKEQLAVIVSERLPDPEGRDKTFSVVNLKFTESIWHHPLSRAGVAALECEFHMNAPPRFRLRHDALDFSVFDGNIGDLKYTVTVLANHGTKDGKSLPGSYVVHFWDKKSGDLQKTESYSLTWRRIGAYDLPETCRVFTATKGLSARSMVLSQPELLK